MSVTAIVIPGGYLFDDGVHHVEVRHPVRNRLGHIEADVLVSLSGGGVLGQHLGWVTSAQFRFQLSQSAAQRNSGDVAAFDTLLLDVELQLDALLGATGRTLVVDDLETWLHGVDTSYRWIVDGLFERGGLYLITALAKSGKTLLGMALLVALAQHDVWLGRDIWRDKPVLRSHAVFAEDSQRVIARRFFKMLGAEPPTGVSLHVGEFHLDENNLDTVIETLHEVDVIYADPLLEVSQVPDLNDAIAVRQALRPWRELARRLDAVVLIAHHHRKDGTTQGARVLGSGQIVAGVDGWIEMDSAPGLGPEQRRLTYSGRDWPPIPEQVVALDSKTLTFSLVGPMSEIKAEMKQAKSQDKVAQLWEALPADGSGLTYEGITQALGWHRNLIGPTVKAGGVGVFTVTGTSKSKTAPVTVHRGSVKPQ